jgi:hypothetical protein
MSRARLFFLLLQALPQEPNDFRRDRAVVGRGRLLNPLVQIAGDFL